MISAGRELDRMIVEEVMGWQRRDGYWITPDDRMVDFPEILICDDRDDSAGLPHYSTDGSAALKVWEKLVGMGYRVSVCWGPGWVSVQVPDLKLDCTIGYLQEAEATAEIVLSAICNVALRIVQGKKTNDASL